MVNSQLNDTQLADQRQPLHPKSLWMAFRDLLLAASG
jgi:hypothetical protein